MPSQNSIVTSSSPTSLSAKLSEGLRSTPRERKPGVYYPSEAGYCIRKLFYSYTEPPKIYGDETLGIFALGDAVHEKIGSMLNRSPGVRLIANEKSFVSVVDLDGVDGFTISGRLDDLVEIEVRENGKNPDKPLETVGKAEEGAAPGGETEKKVLDSDGQKGPQFPPSAGKTVKKTFVVDVKTVKSFDYLPEPKAEHVLQLTFYLRVLREQYPGICGKLLYIKKDDFTMTEFDVPYSDENWRTLVRRLTTLHRTLIQPGLRKHGAEPEAKLVKELNWNCNYCPHRANCDFECGPGGAGYKGMKILTPFTEPVEAYL
jgi:CRISPR/Cas system-associated exonuclease Cas4 (RecB family)